jgi:hypothetical protein
MKISMLAKESRPRFRLQRIALLIGVPIVALACWIAVQPADRMAVPYSSFEWQWLIYDPYDTSAMALRGMNAELGRQAGAPNMPKHIPEPCFSQSIEAPRPAKPRYFLEYPHAALLLFRAGFRVQSDWREFKDTPGLIPPGLPDCSYHNIARHIPENENQIAVWRLFVVASRSYVIVMAVAWMLLIALLEWGYGPGTELNGGAILLLLPGAAFFILNRFDVIPALLTALSFACLGRRRFVGAALFLGLATVVKVYPILFVPLILRYLWPDRRAVLQFVLAYVAANLPTLVPGFFGDDWRAIAAPYLFQLTRPAEKGLTIYGCVLPVHLAHGILGVMFRLTALAAAMVITLATPIPSLSSLLRRCAIVLIAFVTLAVFYSPQWLLWFAPLLLPLVRRDRNIGKSIIALDIVTYLTFPFWFFVFSDVAVAMAKLLYAFPDVGRDAESADFLDDVVTQAGSLLRLLRFICIGFMTWYVVCGEFPVQAWYERMRRHIRRSAPVLAREA